MSTYLADALDIPEPDHETAERWFKARTQNDRIRGHGIALIEHIKRQNDEIAELRKALAAKTDASGNKP